MRPQLHFWRFAVVTAAVAGAIAIPGLPAVASATTPATPSIAAATCATSRPHSGTILHSEIRGGPGTLTIKNTLSQDAAIVLVLGRSKAFSVYVRTHASTTVGNIKDGTYTIYYTVGSRFSTCQGRFTSGATYWRAKNHLPFVSAPGERTVATLILYAVNGNSPITQISPGGFPTP
jgi:hypothetical protein